VDLDVSWLCSLSGGAYSVVVMTPDNLFHIELIASIPKLTRDHVHARTCVTSVCPVIFRDLQSQCRTPITRGTMQHARKMSVA
jgi:hypothetical protein